jgi:transposase
MTMVTIVENQRALAGGVDTHADVHVAAVLDERGGVLGVESFGTDRDGQGQLSAWLRSFGTVSVVGVEGTGSYGAGLARHLRAGGLAVVEVDRPNRQERFRHGKSDPLDAVEAARAAQSGRAVGAPKHRDGNVEAIRALVVAKRSARDTRIKTLNQIRHLVFTAPDDLRERLKDVPSGRLAEAAAALRARAGSDVVSFATKTAVSTLGRRVLALDAEMARLDALIARLVDEVAPELTELVGIGSDTAALLLVAAGDNPERLVSEAAWAALCGVAPKKASSGKVTRHRLNRAGDRQANHALWRVVITRMSCHQPTKDYVARRLAEGKSKKEIIRILKRYVAREVYRFLPRG